MNHIEFLDETVRRLEEQPFYAGCNYELQQSDSTSARCAIGVWMDIKTFYGLTKEIEADSQPLDWIINNRYLDGKLGEVFPDLDPEFIVANVEFLDKVQVIFDTSCGLGEACRKLERFRQELAA